MFSKATLKVFLAIVGIYSMSWIPRIFMDKSGFSESLFGIIAKLPMIYSSEAIRATKIVALNETGGGVFNCMFGCPSTLGWFVVFIFRGIFIWLFSWLLSFAIFSFKEARNIH
jgi:hypothetical protein